MYSPRWSPGLRQGDVLGKINFPLPKSTIQWMVSGGLAALPGGQPTAAVIQATPRFVAVVSHDCEFNEDKRLHFLVARIDDLGPVSDEQIAFLRRGNDVEASAGEGREFPVDSFILDPLPGAFDKPMRINFCTI